MSFFKNLFKRPSLFDTVAQDTAPPTIGDVLQATDAKLAADKKPGIKVGRLAAFGGEIRKK